MFWFNITAYITRNMTAKCPDVSFLNLQPCCLQETWQDDLWHLQTPDFVSRDMTERSNAKPAYPDGLTGSASLWWPCAPAARRVGGIWQLTMYSEINEWSQQVMGSIIFSPVNSSVIDETINMDRSEKSSFVPWHLPLRLQISFPPFKAGVGEFWHWLKSVSSFWWCLRPKSIIYMLLTQKGMKKIHSL